jgi:hypothetical protein
MIAECQQILASGNKCRAIALRGKTHCQHHAPALRRRAPRRNRVRATSLLGPIPEIKNREELQQTLTQTIHALADGSISVYRAQVLITSLQTLAKTL